jgi:CubicO group peptidase (beta-lactamase class C family)
MKRRHGVIATGVALVLGIAVLVSATLIAPSSTGAATPPPPTIVEPPHSDDPAQQAADITAIVESAVEALHLRAAIVKVQVGDDVIIRDAFGESITKVPATPEMRFRNGAVVFQYLGNLLLQFVDEGVVSLDDTIDQWMPELPESDVVTLRMLTNQTTGYPDYEVSPVFAERFTADPFHIFRFQERLDIALPPGVELLFEPGTNWSYAHTNFMILGKILGMIGQKPLRHLIQERILGPWGLTATTETVTSEIEEPFLHTYSAERGATYSEATFWNTQWGSPVGANQTTTIDDLIKTAIGVGKGTGLSQESKHLMTAPLLLGFGESQDNCLPECFPQTEFYNFGLGVVRSGKWLIQTPLLSGIGATEAYLRPGKIAIAVAITLEPEAFSPDGNPPPNPSKILWQKLGAYMSPENAPPVPP